MINVRSVSRDVQSHYEDSVAEMLRSEDYQQSTEVWLNE